MKNSGLSRHRCLFRNAALLGLCAAAAFVPAAQSGDILRGGSSSGARPLRPSEGAAADAATAAARENAKDALARTSQALQAVQALQEAARAAALRAPNGLIRDPNRPGLILPAVPNGLKPGGLEVAPGVPKDLSHPQAGEDPTLWRGARLPQESKLGGETLVVIEQTQQQAILNWRTFNIGKGTRLRVNQNRGGAQKTEWIAFNKITDPTGSPTQILGKIEASGQVYVINQNGIIFGGSSQVNVHNLTASSLPINDALISRGLLNQEKGNVRFLFSSVGADPSFQLSGGTTTYTLAAPVAEGTSPKISATDANGSVPLAAGADFTLGKDPAGKTVVIFTPAGLAKIGDASVSVNYTAATGDVTVLPGALLTSPTTAAKVGGRIALVGPNVSNQGTISTADGQTILAAGREVGFVAHSASDPSLRGLEVFVGTVNGRSGVATNSGLIETPRADVMIAGRTVNQLGVIDSSTSVSLNGRIDLLANYGAVTGPSYDPTSPAGGAPFLNRLTGTVNIGGGSAMRILPELESEETAVGTELALHSAVLVQGKAIHFGAQASLLAPNADVQLSAGTWNFLPPLSNFVNALGQIYFDAGALVSVAGSVDVAIPITQNFLALQLRGSELADSPLQRDGILRGTEITIDIRNTGVFNGLAWVGTPLGDASGFAGLIQRNVGELTIAGGTLKLSAGESVVMQPEAKLDVSGGWIDFQGALVKTTRVLSGGQLLDIAQATPDRVYDGIYTGTFTETHPKYGLSFTFASPLALTGEHFEPSYVQGANGGSIAVTAPSMALDGELRGAVVNGPRQQETPAGASALALTFQKTTTGADSAPLSPTPPRIAFQNNVLLKPADPFSVDGDGNPRALRNDRVNDVALSTELFTTGGFGKVTIDNGDGDFAVPADVAIHVPPRGSLVVSGANIDIGGRISSPGGTLSFTAYNYSPLEPADTAQTAPFAPNLNRGTFTLASGAVLDAAGVIADQSRSLDVDQTLALDGGNVTIVSYAARLRSGSSIDVSGGVLVNPSGRRIYGAGGSISIAAGQDPSKGRESVIGGELLLGATLKGFSGGKGGSLAVKAPRIQIGGLPGSRDTLLLSPEFFRTGGFTSYDLTGLGQLRPNSTEPLPGIIIEPGTLIEPAATSALAILNPGGDDLQLTTIEKPVGVRAPVSLTFNAPGVTNPDGSLFILGDFVMGRNAAIRTDPTASVAINGQTIALSGSVTAPGGAISIAGASNFPLLPGVLRTNATPTVYLAPSARISTAGTTVYVPDAFGRNLGSVLPGGTISISGNIVAAAGAVLDVSGTSGVLDLPPAAVQSSGALNGVVNAGPLVPFASGINAPLWSIASVPTRVDSDGGTITLSGARELFVDATLLGRAGGATALGGTLDVRSGRFYGPNAQPATPADITLIVKQSGLTRPQISLGGADTPLGRVVLGRDGKPIQELGYFAADTFQAGGFDSLSLGGNVQFDGAVTINARRELQVASGGVLSANAAVQLTAPHVMLGTPFLEPVPAASRVAPFFLNGFPFFIPPTFGAGRLSVTADLIDVGNLSLQNIGTTWLRAPGGDIRGNGIFDMAGDLHLEAAQIYPTTAGQFLISAADYQAKGAARPGTISITRSGTRELPFSAGGQLSLFASIIDQGGVLRAPAGQIQIGWEDAATAPQDLLSGKAVPLAQRVTLRSGSVTSVSLLDPTTGAGLLVPFGLSTDGANFIDPTGTDISAGTLAQKSVGVAGSRLTIAGGSTIDLRGGGDLYAYRFVKGNGGSTDLLGWNFAGPWMAGGVYKETQIVSYKGSFYYARTDLPQEAQGQPPMPGPFWRQVAQSFAVLPGYQANFAPYAAFNGNDPGYAQTGLSFGDRVYLGASHGLPAGTYTLLPARYALLPGAVLVTPQSGSGVGTFDLPEGASYVSGYRFNAANDERTLAPIYTRFEVAPSDVARARAEYQDYFANAFLTDRALALEVKPPRIPADAGYLRLEARTGLVLAGNVLASGQPGFHDAWIDISSSLADIVIANGDRAPAPNQIVLNSARLSSYGAESLLIGGVREMSANGVTLTVKTDHVAVDNAGAALLGPEIILAAKKTLTLAENSQVIQSGRIKGYSEPVFIGDATKPGSGDGVLLMVSSDPGARIIRTGVDVADLEPTLSIGAHAGISGQSVTLDSTAATTLDPTARISASTLALNSGQIILQLDPAIAVPAGGLVIGGALLDELEQTRNLSLLTYRSLDIYGSGTFAAAGGLALHAAEIRGFDNGGGVAKITARSLTLDNRAGTVGPGADPALGGALSGTLALETSRLRIGQGALSISQYQLVDATAAQGILFTGSGSLNTAGDFHATTPSVAGTRGIKNSIIALGSLTFDATAAHAANAGGGLGATLTLRGSSVVANSDFILHSGLLTFESTGSNPTDGVSIGGRVDVSGTAQEFYDATRFSSGGEIRIITKSGDVNVDADAVLDVSAVAGGGDAGAITISAPQGSFLLHGSMLGKKGAGGSGGSFSLDVHDLAATAGVSQTLAAGGFDEAQIFRVRTGDVTIDGTSAARHFVLSTDAGDLRVTGTIDAAGSTGGRIDLISAGDLVVDNGATLTVAAEQFSHAGKGGAITLEAGAQINGAVDYSGGARLMLNGGTIDLSVAAVDAIADPAARAAATAAAQERGQFTGTLHFRAPQTAAGNGVNIDAIASTITSGSSIVVEGYRLYDLQQGGRMTNTGAVLQPLGGAITSTNVNVQGSVRANGSVFTANTVAIKSGLFGANAGAAALASIVPGAEIINRSGDVSIGTSATTTFAGDWDLSGMHYSQTGGAGKTGVPGVLTVRAAGNLNFFNALSDGFSGNISGSVFDAQLSAATPGLAANAQSWSYRLSAGADLSAADFRRVQSLDTLAAGRGSLLLGKPLAPNGSSNATAVPRLFQVIRTGSGDIEISTGRDIELRNLFANIYTAGTRLTTSQATMGGTFDVPQPRSGNAIYPAQFSLAGGDVTLSAQGDIVRHALLPSGEQGSQSQLPVNWLSRRGSIDPATGKFAVSPITFPNPNEIASTSWWVDFSNFFEGVGALGGGNVTVLAGGNVTNVDAVIPTNARLAARDSTGMLIAPAAANLLELGGGDLVVRAGADIDGGAYYVERGNGTLQASRNITTNATRNSAILDADLADENNWLPTTLFLGKGQFDVHALGDIRLGPTLNPTLLPAGFVNDQRYRTYFSTYAPNSGVSVTSIGGTVTLQSQTVPPEPGNSIPSPVPIVEQWLGYLQSEATASLAPQPWLRLAEDTVTSAFDTTTTFAPGTLKVAAFSSDIHLVGKLVLSPAPTGTLELLARGAVDGLRPNGTSTVNNVPVTVWSSSAINLSDADPGAIPSVAAPLDFQNFVSLTPGASLADVTPATFFDPLTAMLAETGSTGGTFSTKLALHGAGLLHADDPNPLRIYAAGGDITGLTLFSGKPAQIFSGHDISDIAFYLQNLADGDTSIVAAGRDIVAYNANSPSRAMATSAGNYLAGTLISTGSGGNALPDSEAGDIQISGPGNLEVLAGRNLDLGTGTNRADGTGTGITSIGNGRNPRLSFAGANIVAGAGIGPSSGLANSSIDFENFAGDSSSLFDKYRDELMVRHPELKDAEFEELTSEQQAQLALDVLYLRLRDSGRASTADVTITPPVAQYADGMAAIAALFKDNKYKGDIFTQSRDIRTRNGGNISILAPTGGLTLSTVTIGNPQIPPGIVTESGGAISIFTDGDVNLGISRIFTLRGGDIIIWSSHGDIAAGSSAKTVKSAPPTRVLIDLQSADVKTDLAGLATGGGIGVLATVAGVTAGDVDLIAPTGTVDAGDAGIRATGNLNIAAVQVLNADNIQVGGTSTGVPSAPAVAAPSLSGLAGATNTVAATNNASEEAAKQARNQAAPVEEPDSIVTVEILGDVEEGPSSGQ